MKTDNRNNLKCFRHRLKPSDKYCALCEAKREAKGDFEKARRFYVNRKVNNRRLKDGGFLE